MIVLSIALSEACNLNCTYCNVDKHSTKSIDPFIFLETFKEVRLKNPNEKIQIDFYGGEPLIHFNKIKYIIESIEDKNIQYFMPTNGLLLTKEILEYLVEKQVQLSISFDGIYQDDNRPQHNGNTTTKWYIEHIDLLKQIPNLKIHSMIYPGNYDLLTNHMYIQRLFDVNPQLTIVKDIGVWDAESVKKLKFGIDRLFKWYEEDTTREIPEAIMYYLRSVILYKSKKHEIKWCGAGKSHLSFSENKLIACNRFKDEPELEKLIPQFIEMPECQTCEVKQYCRKGCMYENIKNGKPITEVCDIFKHFYDKINKMIINLKYDKNFREVVEQNIKDEYGHANT